MLRTSDFSLAFIVLWCIAPRTANAGAPYRTDDPEPTPLGHYEFYTFSTGTVVRDDTSGSLPAVELNYGLIPNGQLTIDASVAFDSPSGGATRRRIAVCRAQSPNWTNECKASSPRVDPGKTLAMTYSPCFWLLNTRTAPG